MIHKQNIHRQNVIKSKNNKNSGFSMLEMIIVIAIMAVMVGGSFAAFGLLGSGDSKKATKNIASQLAELRTNTLSLAGSWSAEIYKLNDIYKIDIIKKVPQVGSGTEGTSYLPQLISSTSIGSKIEISFKDSVKLSDEVINENQKLMISFEQGNGKIKEIKLVKLDGTEQSLKGDASISGNITVKVKSSSTKNSLTLWYLTGKLTTDY